MSIALPNVDLSSAVVGTNGIIDLKNVGIGAGGVSSNPAFINNQAALALYNESGCGLTLTFTQGAKTMKLPAGAWYTAQLTPGEYQVSWSVDYVLANPSVSLLLAVYYAPGEQIPFPTLGNSPIGGAVQATGGTTGTADHLINTTNAASSSPIINIEETGASGAQLSADNQGNFQIAQYVSSVLTTIFRVIAGVANGTLEANANVLLSDANHAVQVLNALWIDGPTHLKASATNTAGQANADAWIADGLGSGGEGFVANCHSGDINSHGFAAYGFNSGSGQTGFYAASSNAIGFDASSMNTSGTKAYLWPNGSIDGNTNIIVNGASGSPGSLQQVGANDTQILAAGGITLSGGTSGTATMYQIFRGNVKRVVIHLNNFRTAGVGQFMTFPVAFTSAVNVQVGNIPENFTLRLSGGDVTMSQLTALPASAGNPGTVVTGAVWKGPGFHYAASSADGIQFGSSWVAGRTGVLTIEGV